MKIPFYLDDPDDRFKYNGIDKKYNKLFNYSTSQDGGFLKEFPKGILDDIVFETYGHLSNKYFYPIYVSCDFVHHYFYIDKKICNFDIPLNVIEDIKNNKCKILIFNIYEGYSLDAYDDLIESKILNVYNLNFKDVFLITGNLFTESKKGLKNIYYNLWENIVNTYNDYILKESTVNIFSNKIRKNKFICLQRRPKPQRLMLYTELYDYRNDGILTMGIGDNMKTLDNIVSIENNGFFHDKTFKKYKKKNLRSTLPRQYDAKLAFENPTHDEKVEKYLDSYLHIVSETYFENDDVQMFFSEKIYKPVIFLQPFILFSQPYSLQYLRDLGFKTFHSKYINEDYDKITNDRERFLAALKQVKTIISMSKPELHLMMKDFFDILVHNYCHLNGRYNNRNIRLYADLTKILTEWSTNTIN